MEGSYGTGVPVSPAEQIQARAAKEHADITATIGKIVVEQCAIVDYQKKLRNEPSRIKRKMYRKLIRSTKENIKVLYETMIVETKQYVTVQVDYETNYL